MSASPDNESAVEAVRVLLKAVRVLLKAVRVLAKAIRVLVKAKSACEGRKSACEGRKSACEGRKSAWEGHKCACEGPKRACEGRKSACDGHKSACEGRRKNLAVSTKCNNAPQSLYRNVKYINHASEEFNPPVAPRDLPSPTELPYVTLRNSTCGGTSRTATVAVTTRGVPLLI